MDYLKNNLLLILVTIVGLIFLSIAHTVLTPFLLAAILAYLLNPLVKLLMKKAKFPRPLALTIVYGFIVGLLVFIVARISMIFSDELRELTKELTQLRVSYISKVDYLPLWLQPFAHDLLNSVGLDRLLLSSRVLPYFTGVISGLGSFFVFLVATFYFLKDGYKLYAYVISLFPAKKDNPRELATRFNTIFNNYLRGQLFLIFLMTTVSWLALYLLKVKYALTLGVFTGIAEIVPLIGPVAAAAIAVTVAVLDGISVFALPPLAEGLVVAVIYFILRHIEDLFIMPHIIGRATKLHPLIVLFTVLLGGKLMGIIGLVIAVPIAAVLQTLFVYLNEFNIKEKAH